jgi:hypothetical protein
MKSFFILDVESARHSDLLLWWKPNSCGYTSSLEEAGHYSEAELSAHPHLNNATHTLAVPRDLAEKLSQRVVPGGSTMLNRLQQAARDLLPAACTQPSIGW